MAEQAAQLRRGLAAKGSAKGSTRQTGALACTVARGVVGLADLATGGEQGCKQPSFCCLPHFFLGLPGSCNSRMCTVP